MFLIILANLSDISRHSKSYSSTNYLLILAGFFAIVVVVGLIITLLEKIRSSDTADDSQKNVSLLQTLAQDLGLIPVEVALIEQLASQEQLPAVELMFVDPSLWKRCLESDTGNQDIARNAMTKIFGSEIMEDYLTQDSQSLSSVSVEC